MSQLFIGGGFMRVAICEDNPRELDKVRHAAEAYFSAKAEEPAEIFACGSAAEFAAYLDEAGVPDIALLDIFLPEASGIRIAQEMRLRQEHTEIVFLTSSKEFAFAAFAVRAAHYLLKPYTQAQFDGAMDRAMANLRAKRPKTICLTMAGGNVRTVDIDAILSIEGMGNERIVRTTQGKFAEKKRRLKEFAEELERLSPGQFIAAYRGYIVNQAHIRSIDAEAIRLTDGSSIPIRRGDFYRLRQQFFDWSFRRSGKEAEP